jgi:hypothetical protein
MSISPFDPERTSTTSKKAEFERLECRILILGKGCETIASTSAATSRVCRRPKMFRWFLPGHMRHMSYGESYSHRSNCLGNMSEGEDAMSCSFSNHPALQDATNIKV